MYVVLSKLYLKQIVFKKEVVHYLKNDSIKHINDYADTYALKQSTDEIYSKKK